MMWPRLVGGCARLSQRQAGEMIPMSLIPVRLRTPGGLPAEDSMAIHPARSDTFAYNLMAVIFSKPDIVRLDMAQREGGPATSSGQ